MKHNKIMLNKKDQFYLNYFGNKKTGSQFETLSEKAASYKGLTLFFMFVR